MSALQAIVPHGAVAAEIESVDGTAGTGGARISGGAADTGGAGLTRGEAGTGATERELFAQERAAIEGASDGRRAEFASGRACARRALALLGVAPLALPPGDDGAPRWPAGTVGSITHKRGYCAAVAAFASDLTGVGVDAELDEPLPRGMLATIALADEREAVERLLAERTGVAWDRLLFSAKEASVKAAHPLGLGRPALRASEVSFDAGSDAFTTRVALDGAGARAGTTPASPRVEGRWVAVGGLLVVVAAVRHNGLHSDREEPEVRQ